MNMKPTARSCVMPTSCSSAETGANCPGLTGLVTGEGSSIDVGSRVFLNARGSRTEILARAITTGGNIISRGYIEGNAPDVKGYLECRGLILAEKGMIHAIPELKILRMR